MLRSQRCASVSIVRVDRRTHRIADQVRCECRTPSRCIAIATGQQTVPTESRDGWEFVRDPLPARTEDGAFDRIRRNIGANDTQWQFRPEELSKLSTAIRRTQLENNLLPNYGDRFNPLLRGIIRRTRGYLEEMINPATGSYYLPRVAVRLFGEDNQSALTLGGYLLEAYQEAERFCKLLQLRIKSAGFFKTLLLRRLGSSMEAGRRTVIKLLGHEFDEFGDEDIDFDDDANQDLSPANTNPNQALSDFKNFTQAEADALNRCLALLRQGGSRDPKLESLVGYLLGTQPGVERRWMDLGCILF